MVTLQLTQEQVLQVVASFAKSMGANSAVQPVAQTAAEPTKFISGKRNKTFAIRKAVATFQKHQVFRNADLQIKLGYSVSTVSSALKALRSEGKVNMLKRGTWQVAA